mmetsp:Transcript_56900/g.112046  ORF Transcript_56900/g.112046 Transcript_56900/m.112046 type:complete len:219 (+) Transcript_56900:617-1273(+)
MDSGPALNPVHRDALSKKQAARRSYELRRPTILGNCGPGPWRKRRMHRVARPAREANCNKAPDARRRQRRWLAAPARSHGPATARLGDRGSCGAHANSSGPAGSLALRPRSPACVAWSSSVKRLHLHVRPTSNALDALFAVGLTAAAGRGHLRVAVAVEELGDEVARFDLRFALAPRPLPNERFVQGLDADFRAVQRGPCCVLLVQLIGPFPDALAGL